MRDSILIETEGTAIVSRETYFRMFHVKHAE
jgi:hypothetical protein